MHQFIPNIFAQAIGHQRLMYLRGIGYTWASYHPGWVRDDMTDNEQKAYLQKKLKMVEIEIHSKCNRRCWMCPNATVDRRTSIGYFPEETFLKLLYELKTIRWSNIICFSRFNEPFADDIIFERIKQVRQILPRAFIHTQTNGDYLTPEAISQACKAGLSSMAIQYYAPKNKWTVESSLKRLYKIANRLQLNVKKSNIIYSPLFTELIIKDKRVYIELVSQNFDQERVSRGGMISPTNNQFSRTAPCTYWWNKISIEHNGTVMPCCQLRSDIEEHQSMSMGQITEPSRTIQNILFSEKYITWRRQAQTYHLWPEPCRSCEASAMFDNWFSRLAWQCRTYLSI